MFLQQEVNSALQHWGVIDGNHANVRHEVPTWPATARARGVHDIVKDKHHGVQELDHPAQSSGMEILMWRQVTSEKELCRVDDGDSAVAFSTDGIVT
jgi:hypothetical protein